MSVEDIKQGVAAGTDSLGALPLGEINNNVHALGPGIVRVLLEQAVTAILQVREEAGQTGLQAQTAGLGVDEALLDMSVAVSGSTNADAVDMLSGGVVLKEAALATAERLAQYRGELTGALALLGQVETRLAQADLHFRDACTQATRAADMQPSVVRHAQAYTQGL